MQTAQQTIEKVETQIRPDSDQVLIEFEDRGECYRFSYRDFNQVEAYCENECMGIQFLINANLLRKLVNFLLKLDDTPPYSLDDLSSEAVKNMLISSNEIELIENNFGTSDLRKVARIAAKQTYNFIRKQ
ncbi:hypothetical protein JW960_12005 [candidate division KSB1 bacterium]|nr:hypothetical protein [candidate division KSB1 bacterium]